MRRCQLAITLLFLVCCIHAQKQKTHDDHHDRSHDGFDEDSYDHYDDHTHHHAHGVHHDCIHDKLMTQYKNETISVAPQSYDMRRAKSNMRIKVVYGTTASGSNPCAKSGSLTKKDCYCGWDGSSNIPAWSDMGSCSTTDGAMTTAKKELLEDALEDSIEFITSSLKALSCPYHMPCMPLLCHAPSCPVKGHCDATVAWCTA